METFFVIFSVSVVLVAFYLGTNDCKACRNEPTHIFNLSEHQSLNFGGVALSHSDFLLTPISNEEFGVVFSTKCEENEFYKIIRSFYTNVKNFRKIEERNFFMLEEYLNLSLPFFYGESDGKAYTLDYFMDINSDTFVRVQIYDLEKIQIALVEYDEVKKQEAEQKEHEQQEKLKKEAEEAQIFPF